LQKWGEIGLLVPAPVGKIICLWVTRQLYKDTFLLTNFAKNKKDDDTAEHPIPFAHYFVFVTRVSSKQKQNLRRQTRNV